MAKLQIPLDDELMKEAKLFALENNTTLKEVVTKAIQAYINPNPETQKEPKKKATPKPKKEKPTPEPAPPETYPNPLDDTDIPQKDHYLLRKPCYEGKKETQHTRKTNLMVEWWLEEGDIQYFDENSAIIPFRYKKADGTDYTPNASELKQLEEAYEKQVILEK